MHPSLTTTLTPISRYMKFFRFEGRLYTVVNPSDRESLPGLPNSDPEYNLQGRELRHAIWVTERCPELAYMLRRYDTEATFLARLAIDPKHAPIVRVHNGCMLDSNVRGAWERLEALLLYVSNILLGIAAGNPHARFPFDAFWHEPSEYGYKNVHPHEVAARRAVAKSLDALRALLARTSLAVALTTPDVTTTQPLWVSALMAKKVPEAWIDLVRQSVVADFSSPALRVGAYINPSLNDRGTRWVHHVPTMVQVNVPVYIAWPTDSLDAIFHAYPFLRPMYPVPDQVYEVPHHPDGSWRPFFKWSSLSTTSSGVAPPPARPEPTFPKPGPGQLPGESFYKFVARREAAQRAAEASESASNREKRLAREQCAKTFAQPTNRSSTTVYLWLKYIEVDPWCSSEWADLDHRELIGHSNGRLREVWQLYSHRQKRYDAWTDQWDIYPPLAEEDTRSGDYDDDDDDDSIYADEPPISADEPNAALANPAHQPPTDGPTLGVEHPFAESFATDLRVYYDSHAVDYVPFSPKLQEVARKRYGVVTMYDNRYRLAWKVHNVAALRRITGYLEADLPHETPFSMSLSAFVDPFLVKGDRDPRAPERLWDLAPRHPESLLAEQFRHPCMILRRVRLNGTFWYRICYATDDDSACPWDLILKSATTVLELMRQHGVHSRCEAAMYMVTRGMPFNTIVQPSPRDNVRLLPDIQVVLGWRSKQDLNRYDYWSYETRVRSLLRGPRARAALLCGGIVWRLALEVMRENRIEEVAFGPSKATDDYAMLFRSHRSDDYRDDKLSPDELDLICGVYKVTINDGQTEDRSWWPKDTHWRSSHMDQGFWTPWCESWFLRRLRQIRTGEVKIHNAQGWTDNLRLASKAKLFSDSLELASNNWLKRHFKVREEDM